MKNCQPVKGAGNEINRAILKQKLRFVFGFQTRGRRTGIAMIHTHEVPFKNTDLKMMSLTVFNRLTLPVVASAVLLWTNAPLADADQPSQPVIELRGATDDHHIDLGSSVVGQTTTVDVTIVNQTGQPLKLEKVTSGCGCTSVMINRRDLASGDAAEIRVSVRRESSGRFTVGMKIYSASDESWSVTLKGEALEPFQFHPEIVRWRKDGNAVIAVELVNNTDKPFEPTDRLVAGSLPPGIQMNSHFVSGRVMSIEYRRDDDDSTRWPTNGKFRIDADLASGKQHLFQPFQNDSAVGVFPRMVFVTEGDQVRATFYVRSPTDEVIDRGSFDEAVLRCTESGEKLSIACEEVTAVAARIFKVHCIFGLKWAARQWRGVRLHIGDLSSDEFRLVSSGL